MQSVMLQELKIYLKTSSIKVVCVITKQSLECFTHTHDIMHFPLSFLIGIFYFYPYNGNWLVLSHHYQSLQIIEDLPKKYILKHIARLCLA